MERITFRSFNMKIKVTILLTLLFMLLFSGTAYADSYESTTQAVVIDTVWSPNTLEDTIEALISPNVNTDVLHLTIVAGSGNSRFKLY